MAWGLSYLPRADVDHVAVAHGGRTPEGSRGFRRVQWGALRRGVAGGQRCHVPDGVGSWVPGASRACAYRAVLLMHHLHLVWHLHEHRSLLLLLMLLLLSRASASLTRKPGHAFPPARHASPPPPEGGAHAES